MGVSLYPAGESHARSLISSGKVNAGAWSFSAEDGNGLLGASGDDWAAYALWHLAEDTSAEDNTKARWKYPYGKGGEVYTAALKAIEGRATQQGLSALSDSAGKLLAAATPDDEGPEKKSADVEPETRAMDEAGNPSVLRDAADGDPDPDHDPDDDGDDDSDPDKDDDEDGGMRMCRSGMAHARALVKAGKVDHGPFSFDAADRAAMLGPNGSHTSEYARHHLGKDEDQGDDVKQYAYPFGKDGKAYSRAFRSIARRAAAAGHGAVSKAATDLMELAKPPADESQDDAPPPRPKKGRSGRPRNARVGGLKYRDLPFQVTSSNDDGSHFEGYAAVLNNIDEYGTIMGVGCFDRDLDAFRTDGFLGGLNHDWDNPIGAPSVVRLDGRGLFVGGDVIDTAHGLDVRKLLKNRIVKKLSFGFDVLEQEYLEDDTAVRAYWKSVGYQPGATDAERAKHGALLFRRIKVYEASPVMVPGNAMADITAVRSDEGDEPDFRPPLTLESHSLAVHAAVGELCDRHEQLARMRSGQGRSLSRDKLAQLGKIRDRIDAALAACQPKAKASDVAALRREMLNLSARVHRPS